MPTVTQRPLIGCVLLTSLRSTILRRACSRAGVVPTANCMTTHFLFVNGIAICYDLVPRPMANAIMDRLLVKMREVGFTRFDLGLPGNLVVVPRKDYVHRDRRWGGGEREDNADGFQIYENEEPPLALPTSRWLLCTNWIAAKRPTAFIPPA